MTHAYAYYFVSLENNIIVLQRFQNPARFSNCKKRGKE